MRSTRLTRHLTDPVRCDRALVRPVWRTPSPGLRGRAGTAAQVLVSALLALSVSFPAIACEFEPVKQQIDNVLDHDKHKAERFRREVKDGYDSMKVLNDLLPPQWRDKLDQCRFFAAEYLAKRGFPPAH